MKTAEYSDRFCITAYGAITPIGNTIEEIFESLRNGKSGMREIEKFDHRAFKTSKAGVPAEGNFAIHSHKKNRFRNGDIFYGQLVAKRLAEQLDLSSIYHPDEIGCMVGIEDPAMDIDNIIAFHKDLPNDIDRKSLITAAVERFRIGDLLDTNTSAVLKAIHNIIPFSGQTISELGLCSASTHSIGLAMRSIARGEIKAAICGGISARVTPLVLIRLEGMNITTTDEQFSFEARSRPFDRKRSGFVLSEGAVLFSIEKESAVKARNSKPLAFLMGYGGSLGAQNIVAPHNDDMEMILSMQRALEDAKMTPAEIDMISAHGTSTQQNDLHESRAIVRVCGKPSPPVIATKSNHGHLMATAGAMEILTVLAGFQNNFMPGIINLDEPDPQLPDGITLVRENTYKPLRYVLKNSFGMGGTAGSLILGNPNMII